MLLCTLSMLPLPRASSLHSGLLGRRLGEELGRGAFGVVYHGLDSHTGQHVAIKQLSLDRIPGDCLQVRQRVAADGGSRGRAFASTAVMTHILLSAPPRPPSVCCCCCCRAS